VLDFKAHFDLALQCVEGRWFATLDAGEDHLLGYTEFPGKRTPEAAVRAAMKSFKHRNPQGLSR
jgi:hypothetical protein